MAGDVRNQVTPQDAGSSPRLFHDTMGIQVHMRDHALLRTSITQMSCQRPGIQPFDADDASLLQILIKPLLAPPIAGATAGFFHHEAFGPDPPGLGVFTGDPIVPDVRAGHRDNLALVGRIGQDLLIPAHRRIEHDLADGFAIEAQSTAFKHRPVREREDGFLHLSLFARREP